MSALTHSVIELYTPGTAITAVAAEDIKQGQFVALTEATDPELPSVKVAPAGARIFGIAATAVSKGNIVGIQRGNSRCFRLPTTTPVTAGAALQVGANGQPEPATDGHVVAIALASNTGIYADITLT